MIKQHSQIINFLMRGCDLAVVGGAWVAAVQTPFWLGQGGGALNAQTTRHLPVALLASLIVLTGTGLYKPRRDKSFLLEIGQLIKASFIVWSVLIVLNFFLAGESARRGVMAAFLPWLAAGLIMERGAYRSALRYIRRRGWNLRHALIVGTGRLGQSVFLRLQHNSWTGIRVAGFIEGAEGVPGAGSGDKRVCGVPVLGHAGDLRRIVEQTRADSVFIALPSSQGELLRQVIGDLEATPADVRLIPDLFLSRFPAHVAVSELDGMPIISLRENPLAGWPAVYKRMFDVAGAAFGLVLSALPMMAIAAAIKSQDGGPVLYRQRRVSFGRQPFYILKFRTMRADAEADGPAFAGRNDPRCTRLGKWLRSTSLDELPQLFNVLWGEMSLVGPRPERPEMLDRIQEEVPGFPMRLKVRAGLTGWAQINGYRGRTSFRKRLQYDLYYLNHWSPLLDVRIVFATIFRLFRQTNAY